MNERIRQLAEQVYGTQATEQEIKFAELIVQECIDIVEDAGGIDKYHYTGAIGKHFGVESA